jgi:penicillin-binding protein 2
MSLFDKFYQGIEGDFGRSRIVASEDIDKDFDDDVIAVEARPNIRWIWFVMLVVFVVLVSRLWFLQITRGEYYLSLAEGNRIRTEYISATRGLVYDRKGNKLVQNLAGFNLEIEIRNIPSKKNDIIKSVKELSSIIDIPEIEILSKINEHTTSDPIILKSNITRYEALILEEKLSSQKLASVREYSTRSYVPGFGLGHLLGYVGKASEQDLEQDSIYQPTDLIGKLGLEAYYEDYLRGTSGKEYVEVDAIGKIKRVLASQEASSGNSLELTLDLDLQKKVYETVKSAVTRRGSPGGVAILMNPKNGSIYSMVSYPDFDPNLFTTSSGTAFQKGYSRLLKDDTLPLFNRAISGVYPSGSTIKPVLAAGALNEGTITASTSIYANGYIEVPNQYDPSVIYTFPDWKVHGLVDTRRAIAVSSDVFFYAVGGGYEHIKGLGLEKIRKYYEAFGLGSKTNIDLTSEKPGLVPSEEWKQKTKGESWYQGDTYHLSIGQGDLLATPLQVLNFTAAIANGGKLLRPHLVSIIRDSDGSTVLDDLTKILNQNMVSRSALRIVQEGMRQTVTSGTAQIFNSLSVNVAAKTGTAQFDNNAKTHTWVTAYAPYEDPELALVVVLEGGKPDGESAMPAAREIMRYFFKNRQP